MLETPLVSIYTADQYFGKHIGPVSNEAVQLEARPNLPRALIVDDERLVADTLGKILEMSGFQVAVAYSGQEALERAVRFQPDYLISDVFMPQMNGVELSISMRRKYPDTRIVLLTGKPDVFNILLEKQSERFEFELLAKPIHPLELIGRLKGD